jgi:hypothetical protein
VSDEQLAVDRAMVLALLTSHGITAPDADIDAITSGYSASRQMVALLHAMPDVRYEVPATTFDPRVGDA